MWNCQECGTTNIAAGLPFCPHCGAPYSDQKESSDDMAKVTKLGGASGWPNQAEPDGTDSSVSTEQQETSSTLSEQQNPSPALSTEQSSSQDQTDSSGALSTAGDPSELGIIRETDEGVGDYDTWRKEDLQHQADVRGLPYNTRTTNAELAAMLREDDATDPANDPSGSIDGE